MPPPRTNQRQVRAKPRNSAALGANPTSATNRNPTDPDTPDYLYFYGHTRGRYACLSNFFSAPFSDPDYPGITFPCSEHYMMYRKALLFSPDTDHAQWILEDNSPTAAKRIGRTVPNFDPSTWDAHAEEAVERGVYLKFKTAHNGELRDILIETRGRRLVEASPYDRLWGIGFKREDAERNRHRWGENRLGKVLERVRERLIKEMAEENDSAPAAANDGD